MKKLITVLVFLFFSFILFGQEKSLFMDFRSQQVSDIIYAVADVCGESVYVDETVTGTATFHFEDSNFEQALKRFADYCQLYIDKQDGVYYITKVKIDITENGLLNINTENVNIEIFLNFLSRKTNTTILYDSLPNTNITLRVQNAKVEDVLNLTIVKLPSFVLERIASGYYITKNTSSNSKRNVDIFTISMVEDKFDISIQKAMLANVIEVLFKKASKEFTLLCKSNIQLESVYFSEKVFDDVIKLLLEQANCDFSVTNGVYYIYEIQRKDVIKNYKETKVIYLKYIDVENLISLLPSDFNSNAFIKTNKQDNSVILNGSTLEIKPIEDFITQIDVQTEDKKYTRFELKNISVKEALSIMGKSFPGMNFYELPDANSFVSLVTGEKENKLKEFIKQIDVKQQNYEVRLNYIKSEELVKNLPPSVTRENIVETANPNLVFFKGNEGLYKSFIDEVEKIDSPKQQIRYQLLVIQRQKTNGKNIGSTLSVGSSTETSGYSWNGTLSNIFNINFDIISQFGLQFAGSINAELSEGKSHVLADTTLNAISGETINFSNTNTYRYRDIIVDKGGDIYSSTTREIASGLVLNINGWVSGEDMVTVKVDAQVSKQGRTEQTSDDTTNPPSTSEKKVSTNVRTKSGEPVVIGGLFQTETDVSVKKTPFLGSIPILGHLFKKTTESIAETEFIIYLVPFVQKNETEFLSEGENLKRLKLKYENN